MGGLSLLTWVITFPSLGFMAVGVYRKYGIVSVPENKLDGVYVSASTE